jgi:hypothetical protein
VQVDAGRRGQIFKLLFERQRFHRLSAPVA